MEYIYASMLLHKAGKQVTEDNVKKVMEAAGLSPDTAKIRALISALEGVNIDEVIKQNAVGPVAAAPAAAAPKAEAKKEEKKEEKVNEESAAAGLGSLFG